MLLLLSTNNTFALFLLSINNSLLDGFGNLACKKNNSCNPLLDIFYTGISP